MTLLPPKGFTVQPDRMILRRFVPFWKSTPPTMHEVFNRLVHRHMADAYEQTAIYETKKRK